MKDKKTKRQILIRLTEQNYLKAIEACDVMKDENINRFVNLFWMSNFNAHLNLIKISSLVPYLNFSLYNMSK